jgi:hypothetical protein
MEVNMNKHDTQWNEISSRTFCGKEVNIKEYYGSFDPNSSFVKNKQKNATFIKYGWLDISTYTLSDECLSNIAVRTEQNLGAASEDMAHSYEVEGWDTNHFPPIVGTDYIPRDGRTRIRAALLKGEKYIPCAIFSYEHNNSVLSNISNALLANNHKLQNRPKWQDFISGGVEIILSGEIPCTIAAVENWLYNKVDIEYFYSNVGGNITKLANQIYTKAKESSGGHLTVLRERGEWKEWLTMSIQKHSTYYRQNYDIWSIDDITFYESGGNRPEQTWCRYIMPNAMQNKVTNIVIYTCESSLQKACINHNNYSEELVQFHKQTYQMVNNELSSITLARPVKTKAWRIIGVIPQIYKNEDHKKMLKQYKLAKLSDFKPQGNSLDDLLNVA